MQTASLDAMSIHCMMLSVLHRGSLLKREALWDATMSQQPPTLPISVVVLTQHQDTHWRALLRALFASDALPTECIIVHLNEPVPPPSLTFSTHMAVRHVKCPSSTHATRSLGYNFARDHVRTDMLLFLDVRTVPTHGLVGGLYRAVMQRGGLAMADVQHMTRDEIRSVQRDSNWGLVRNRRALERGAHVEIHDPICFQGLSFACSTQTYDALGGFDTNLLGIGAEELDMAFAYHANGGQLWMVGHRIFLPQPIQQLLPYHHFDDIVYNAQAFHKKWRVWPMSEWLTLWNDLGLIEWCLEAQSLKIIRSPTAHEVEAAYRVYGRYY